MKLKKIQLILTGVCTVLLLDLFYRFFEMPGGMILPGYYFGMVMLIAALFGCLIITGVIKSIWKSVSIRKVFSISALVALCWMHYMVYSPTLHIIVPENYRGEVKLILTDTSQNQLRVDNNGIGHITRWTYDKTYLKPIVINSKGVDVSAQCIPFNNSSFWALGKGPNPKGTGSVRYLAFRIE